MRLALYSDLHLEFAPWWPPGHLDADVVVLAGDIGIGVQGLAWAKTAFAGLPVVYVAGNHEFYHQDWRGLIPQMRRAAGAVHFLENDQWIWPGPGGPVRFLGATLWTDFALDGDPAGAQNEAAQIMTDYRVIGNGEDRLDPQTVVARHRDSLSWLVARLDTPFDGPTVVVTHHAPARRCLAGRRAALGPYYASDLEILLRDRGPALWGFTAIATTALTCAWVRPGSSPINGAMAARPPIRSPALPTAL